jgi:outer membrane protein OmpA-like peptidoglycan-associated protein
MIKAIITTVPILGVTACHSSASPESPDSVAASDGSDDGALETAAADEMLNEKKAGFNSDDSGEAKPERVSSATSIKGTRADCGDVAVYFQTDSAELSEAGKQSLDEVAQCLTGTKTKDELSIVGEADPRGTEAYNEDLSRRRAKSVADYLSQKGVDEGSFEVYARGEEGAVEGMPRLWPEQRKATLETE